MYTSVNLPSLVQIIACRLVGAEPLPEPMMEYCYLILRNKLHWKINRNIYIYISFKKMHLKMSSATFCHFTSDLSWIAKSYRSVRLECKYGPERRTVYVLIKGLFWRLFPELWSNEDKRISRSPSIAIERRFLTHWGRDNKCIFLNEDIWIMIDISLKNFPKSWNW